MWELRNDRHILNVGLFPPRDVPACFHFYIYHGGISPSSETTLGQPLLHQAKLPGVPDLKNGDEFVAIY